MRSRIPNAMVAIVLFVAIACADTDLPLEPGHKLLAPDPQKSVVTFGMTVIGDPANRSSARAINDLGQVLFAQGPEPFRPFVLTNGSLLRLEHPFDADQVQGVGLNVDGRVVGNVDLFGAAWVGRELTLLDRPQGYATAQARAINDRGQIVGAAQVLNAGLAPVYWANKDAGMVALAGRGIAEDVNNAGAIVGQALNEAENSFRGVYWASPTSLPRPLKGPDGQPCGAPQGINDRNEIVGFCRSSAAYWSSPDANAVLLEGGEGSADDINELGQIVGSTRIGDGDFRGILWQREGASFRAFDLGKPADREDGAANEINNRGQAVGGAFGGFQNTGLLWQVAVRVEMDVVPGAGATIRLGKGTVAAALLGSRWFQTGEIDPGTLTLGNDDGIETPVARKKGTPIARLTDVNRDGFVDLVVEFDKQAMTRSDDLVAGAQTLIVQGALRNGTRLRGADVVTGVR